ncbi:hypothetical protein KJ763_01245 [Patescibacteria group bacterium]|nr:hypothetical protein [Patescibacteria group bacterium]
MFFKRLFEAIFLILGLVFTRNIKIEGKKIHLTGPLKLRFFFEKMGGAFMRFGQVLALRQDFLSYRYSNELLYLLDQDQPVSYDKIRKVFLEEKNISPETFFANFENQPIYSSPLAQVYRAFLKDGAEVVVKIQKPEAKKLFEEDFRVLIFLSLIADFFRLFSKIQIQEIVSQFISWSKYEMDFTIEAKNAFIACKHNEEYPRTIIPKQYIELSSPRVLIQEFIGGGVSVADFIKKRSADIDAQKLSYYLIFDVMRQYFIEGFFHADPHPSNLIFLPGDKLVYLDFGIVGKSESKRLPYLKILYGIAGKDVDCISEGLFGFEENLILGSARNSFFRTKKEKESYEKISEKIKELIMQDLKKDLIKILEKNTGQIFLEIKKLSEKYNIYLPKEIILHLRVLASLNSIALEISPSFDIIKALNYFFERYSQEKVSEIINEGEHEDLQENIIGIDDQVNWEVFKEIVSLEKEKRAVAKERFIEMASYYAEKYKELRSMIKKIK